MGRRNGVATKISGGLGNQLFQYAAGLAVCERTGGDLYLNLRAYQQDAAEDRPFLLPAFGIRYKQWRPVMWRVDEYLRRWSDGRLRVGPETVPDNIEMEERFFTVEPPCYLRGYFQSWRYFANVEGKVRETFDTDKLAILATADLERRIRSAECPIALHVRRGDYEYRPGVFNLMGRDYYEAARDKLDLGGRRPTYFLFSDDLPQASSMLADWPDLIPVSGFDALQDFRLMSLCKHFIIANSTFSWWAAWLGRAPDKRVVSSTDWFGPGFFRRMDPDVRLPPDWIRV